MERKSAGLHIRVHSNRFVCRIRSLFSYKSSVMRIYYFKSTYMCMNHVLNTKKRVTRHL